MEKRHIPGIHLLAHGVDGVGHVEVEHVYAQRLRRLDRRPGVRPAMTWSGVTAIISSAVP